MPLHSAPNLTGVVVGGVGAIVLFYLAIGILNFVAIFKIITKAGYSGWWILLPLAPIIGSVVALVALDTEANSPFSTPSISLSNSVKTIVGWVVFLGIATFANWIFFLIFAFSDWPVRRQARGIGAGMTPLYPIVPSGPHAQTPIRSAPQAQTPLLPKGVLPVAQAGPPSATATEHCPNCSATHRPGSSFCGSCGHRLDVPASVRDTPTTMATTALSPAVASPPRHAASATQAVPVEGGAAAIQQPTPSSPPNAPRATVCPSCQGPELSTSAFCGQCGARMAPTA